MNNIPVIRLDSCILPYCNKYISLSNFQKEIEYAYDNKCPILLVYENNNYGTLFCPESTNSNVHIVTNDIAKIISSEIKDIELCSIETKQLQITQECFEYKGKILEILELVYNSQDQLSKSNVNDILLFIQKQNMLSNLNNFSIEKFVFIVYDQIYREEHKKYFALLHTQFIDIYKICFLKIKEILLEQQESNLINKKIQDKIQEHHKKLFLQEKISILNEELGHDNEFQQLKKKLLKLPEKPQKIGLQELSRLEKMPNISSESAIIRNYINWLISLPWGKNKKLTKNMKEMEDIINNSHMGLEDVKHQVKLLLVSKLRNNNMNNAPILLLGPPGVGKTSIVQAIAKALDLPHQTISLAGVNDSTLLLGTMRSYLGAIPGKFIQTMKKLNYINGIIHLDEIDKMSNDILRSPMNALIAILDPTQNNEFQDAYLDIEFDFSQVLFILTANSLDNIPSAILNRINIVKIPGYSLEEKKAILPKLIEKSKKELSIKKNEVTITPSVYSTIITNYTHESGVRQLTMVLKNILQNAILQIECENKKNISISKKNIKLFINNEQIEPYEVKNLPGCCTGLAWTSMGGKLCPIEAFVKKLEPQKIVITGNLGKVMEESVKVALSCLSNIFNRNIYDSYIHLHVPEGAIPKDGPSAGITIFSALYSHIENIILPEDLAMTGELTLSGKVTAIGGLKEKLIAAIEHNITKVIIPKNNSILKIPNHIKNKLDIIQISSVNELIDHLR